MIRELAMENFKTRKSAYHSGYIQVSSFNIAGC